MDITKYLKNKDVELSNDDFNIEKLEKDIRKGYVLSEEVETARSEALKDSTSKYTELETKYNSLDKSYNDLQAKNVEQTNTIGSLKLQVEMMNQGFSKDKFEEVSKLRSSLYAEEQDDAKAISMIKENFQGTYFPKAEEKAEVPNETPFTAGAKSTEPIKITRKTSIKDLLNK
mgnify:CR=1 FL=1